MKIKAYSSSGDSVCDIQHFRAFNVSGALLHINQQPAGKWHVLHGSHLIPRLSMLRTITIKPEGQGLADIEINGPELKMRRRAVIVMRDSDLPYIQFEADLVGVITIYCTRNFMAGQVPAHIELEV